MTSQESFKRRIRERMAATGERYCAARRVLLDQATARRPGRQWVSEPANGDDAVRAATGRGWDEWCDLLDAWPGHDDGHTAIATHLREDLGVDGWWAQAVTVGYERITGRRLPHQMADGTFTAGRSRTVAVGADLLRSLLLDDDGRAALFGGLPTELRSRPTTKALRVAVGPGVALIDLQARPDGRTRVSVAHERLPEPGDVEHWKAFWGEWLEALDEG